MPYTVCTLLGDLRSTPGKASPERQSCLLYALGTQAAPYTAYTKRRLLRA